MPLPRPSAARWRRLARAPRLVRRARRPRDAQHRLPVESDHRPHHRDHSAIARCRRRAAVVICMGPRPPAKSLTETLASFPETSAFVSLDRVDVRPRDAARFARTARGAGLLVVAELAAGVLAAAAGLEIADATRWAGGGGCLAARRVFHASTDTATPGRWRGTI